jgi:release factor glutamine methyltransferase
MNFLFRIVSNKFIKPFLNHYLRKERTYKYNGLTLTISPGVFHPGFFFSTKFLVDFVNSLELKNKTFCEPGTGSGLVSLSALKKGARVTAFDINPSSVKNCRENFVRNKFLFDQEFFFEVYLSDLFDSVSTQAFDYIVVNPPYFFSNPIDDVGKAWYAGANGEYFEKLFQQINAYIHHDSKVYMILGDNCEIDRIENIAKKYGLTFSLVKSKKIWWEKNYIFKIEKVCN